MHNSNRLNQYRIMWILVLFDLPTDTKKERKAASNFRTNLKKDGFTMFQFSIYQRCCGSRENAKVHINRVKKLLPEYGKVGIFMITDHQWGLMEVYHGRKLNLTEKAPTQLQMF